MRGISIRRAKTLVAKSGVEKISEDWRVRGKEFCALYNTGEEANLGASESCTSIAYQSLK
jgi:hypothetical protein